MIFLEEHHKQVKCTYNIQLLALMFCRGEHLQANRFNSVMADAGDSKKKEEMAEFETVDRSEPAEVGYRSSWKKEATNRIRHVSCNARIVHDGGAQQWQWQQPPSRKHPPPATKP